MENTNKPTFDKPCTKKKLVTVYLDEKLHEQVQAIAEANDIPVNKAYVGVIKFGVFSSQETE